jgi:AraC family transcriptional regulator of arabinose operon
MTIPVPSGRIAATFALLMHASARSLLIRPHPKPTLPLPVCVRSVGHYRLVRGDALRNLPRPFWQLFWGVAGQGVFRVGRRRVPFHPGRVFVYQPHEAHHLEPLDAMLEYRWLTLDGPRTGALLAGLGLGRSQEAGLCPAPLFEAIARHIQSPTAEGERSASVEAYALLVAAARPVSESAPVRADGVERARLAFDRQFADPRFNINQLCLQLDTHRSTLFRQFRRRHGVAPIQYLNRLRLREALRLLRETRLAVAEVARRSGIGGPAYLSRLVRRATGQSPRAFRAAA